MEKKYKNQPIVMKMFKKVFKNISKKSIIDFVASKNGCKLPTRDEQMKLKEPLWRHDWHNLTHGDLIEVDDEIYATECWVKDFELHRGLGDVVLLTTTRYNNDTRRAIKYTRFIKIEKTKIAESETDKAKDVVLLFQKIGCDSNFIKCVMNSKVINGEIKLSREEMEAILKLYLVTT